jgi:hypothetical protein
MTEEESLLAAALRAVRGLCAARGLLSLNLAPPAELGFLAQCLPPAIAGQPRLTPLQQRVQELYFRDARLLLVPEDGRAAAPTLLATAHLEAEIAACARWCRELLQQDGAYRLLVVSAWSDPGAHAQGALLWREFAGSSAATATEEQRTLLAVEGGEPLLHQALVADALAALSVLGEWIDTAPLLRLLRSAYFDFGNAARCSWRWVSGGWRAGVRWRWTKHWRARPAGCRRRRDCCTGWPSRAPCCALRRCSLRRAGPRITASACVWRVLPRPRRWSRAMRSAWRAGASCWTSSPLWMP